MKLTELQAKIDDLRSELSAVQAINHSRELDNAELRKLLERAKEAFQYWHMGPEDLVADINAAIAKGVG